MIPWASILGGLGVGPAAASTTRPLAPVPTVLPHADEWVVFLVAAIALLFLGAAGVGPAVRALLPEPPPRADDPHGHGDHHP